MSNCANEQPGVAAVELDADDIGGVVSSAVGPEAGVWVIAETDDLPTPFVRIVVTDDDGRYVLPDLPDTTYDLFVRGYGLVDSPRVIAMPGQRVDLEAGMAKLFASEVCGEVTLDAMRVHGGYGYIKDFDVERYYRDAPLMIIGEGTNEIQKLVIARRLLERYAI